jgi:hypothetical protein
MMDQRVTRRRMLRMAGRLAAGLGLGGALVAKSSKPAEAETCFWKRMSGPVCSGGQLVEYWCFRCCAGTQCWNEWCETRFVGTC